MGKKRLDLPQKEQLASYYSDHSYVETLKQFNLSGSTLDRLLKKYGLCRKSSHDKNAKNITKETLLQYYVVENHSKEETRKHFNLTNHALSQFFKEFGIRKQKSVVISLRKKTLEEVYGNPNWNNRTKFRETCNDLYGGVGFQSETLRQRGEKTVKEKYGNEDIRKTDYFKAKSAETKLRKYGDSKYNNLEQRIQTCVERYGGPFCPIPRKESKVEVRVRNLLGARKVHVASHEFDAYVKTENRKLLIEIDGDYWHPSKLEGLQLGQIRTVVNDIKKEIEAKRRGYAVIRIHESNIPSKDSDVTVENLEKLSYVPDLSLSFDLPIVSRDTFKKAIEKHGKDSVEKYCLEDLVELVQLQQPSFPSIPCTEDLKDVIKKIHDFDYEPRYTQLGMFSHNCISVGSNTIKSRFKSFWKSSWKGRQSPVEAWQNRDTLLKILRYRIGINNTGEVFDFNIKNILRGFNVNRMTVSFFRPALAAAIYRHFLGQKKDPVVFDPCCGFGARLLAFKSCYPDGTYYGCEPQKETFQELERLTEDAGFTNVHIYNTPLESLQSFPEVDFTFTCPPYFDLEDYKIEGLQYDSFSDWRSSFWDTLIGLPNSVYIINQNLFNTLSDDSLIIIDKVGKGVNPTNKLSPVCELLVSKNFKY